MIAALSNSNAPLKRYEVLRSLGFDIKELFDAFVVSGDYGIRKPNPELVNIVRSKLPPFKDYEICLIGDQLDRDIMCAR